VDALRLGILADDLSGAAECAAHAKLRVSRSIVSLTTSSSASPAAGDGPGAIAVDTHTRGATPEQARVSVAAAAGLVSGADVVVKKVDSLLRGNLAAEIASLAAALDRLPVVAVANPALGRVVSGGILHLAGTPLHATDLWQVEHRSAPESVAEALSPLATGLVPQATVDAGVAAVAQALRELAAAGLVPVLDAASEGDLDVIRAAAVAALPRPLLVGSGALVLAVVRALEPRPGALSPADRPPAAVQPRPGAAPVSDGAPALPQVRSLLVVLGTRATGIAEQLARLVPRAARVERFTPSDLLTRPADVLRRLGHLPADGLVVVALDPDAPADPKSAPGIVRALADAVAVVAPDFGGLFLSGGETARAVLDRLGVESLDVVGALEPGTVVSRTPAGQVVVTRPGSFGGPASIARTADALLTGTATSDGIHLAVPDDPAHHPETPAPRHPQHLAPTKENP
jgi:4-hydroxythreonine-4-phosphate dehydrogenase